MKAFAILLTIYLSVAGDSVPSPCQVLTSDGEAPKQMLDQRSPVRQDLGLFRFRKEVEEVVLNLSVLDERHQPVSYLNISNFTVTESGKPQKITSFRREDIPVAMGLVVDSSASMIEIRSAVNQAALNLVNASNERDQVFIVNFNKDWYLDQGFTSDVNKLRSALDQVEFRGSTALFDAMRASVDYLKTNVALEKRVLIVITDGDDNMSSNTLQETAQALAVKDGPIVYTIGILHDERKERLERALRLIAESTGGIAYLPKSVEEVNAISMQVARDIRNQYTISYRPSTPKEDCGYRTIKVVVNAPRNGKLIVRTKTGYFPEQHCAFR
ncbi:MAG: VWA domain-containing protein [Terriglobia bacterium]|nr:VWA domain-containing protein [Terriglobia bacterium]